ncbi:rap guanine nucleotide exchange factor 5-like [Cervus elaphus]|uniref:rap guanine nucleotide exchange factor 5-like n=1 Tax=Cervus elaphus TaxID=9860 RepID=UPI001CC30C6D|nr:rap guanine nucleotide exchange factor 5-like [Cervus elaphus]
MATGVWQLLLDMGILSSVDQHLYFQDTYVFYQISSDECNYLYWEFKGEEAWQNGVRLLLQLVPLIPSRAGICELSHQKIEDSEESSDEILACLISADLWTPPGPCILAFLTPGLTFLKEEEVSPRTDSGHLSRSGQDHSSSPEPHPKLRKRRPWALG